MPAGPASAPVWATVNWWIAFVSARICLESASNCSFCFSSSWTDLHSSPAIERRLARPCVGRAHAMGLHALSYDSGVLVTVTPWQYGPNAVFIHTGRSELCSCRFSSCPTEDGNRNARRYADRLPIQQTESRAIHFDIDTASANEATIEVVGRNRLADLKPSRTSSTDGPPQISSPQGWGLAPHQDRVAGPKGASNPRSLGCQLSRDERWWPTCENAGHAREAAVKLSAVRKGRNAE
jgi:hypothetical protein